MFPHGLMFHHFHGGLHKPDMCGSLSAEDFESILLSVGIQNVVSPHEWLHRLSTGNLHEMDVCITFDDALRSQFDVCLPVLKKYNIEAFWFIYSAPFQGIYPPLDIFRRFRCQFYETTSDYYANFFKAADLNLEPIFQEQSYKDFFYQYSNSFPFYAPDDINYRYVRDRVLEPMEYQAIVQGLIDEKGISMAELCDHLWLNENHLTSLHAEGHVIGLHSYDHPTNLASLTEQEQQDQYYRNYEHITRLGEKPKSMSHPCNSYNDTTIKLLKDLGIVCGFRSNMTGIQCQQINSPCLEIAREDSSSLLKKSKFKFQQSKI